MNLFAHRAGDPAWGPISARMVADHYEAIISFYGEVHRPLPPRAQALLVHGTSKPRPAGICA